MTLHKITVMQAIEDEVQHNRREMRRLKREHGEERAEASWEARKIQLINEVIMPMVFAQEIGLSNLIAVCGMIAYDLELLTKNEVVYEE